MRYEKRVRVDAAAGTVWRLLADLGNWPGWTPTVTSVTVEDARAAGPEVAVGQRAVVKQPGRRPAVYTVQEVVPGRRFQWGRSSGGVRQRADHRVEPDGAERCSVTLVFAMEGPVGGPLGRLGAGTIRKTVDTEAASLKAAAERTDPPEPAAHPR